MKPATVRRVSLLPSALWLTPTAVPNGLDIFVREIHGERRVADLYTHLGEVVMDKGDSKTDTSKKNHR